MKSLLKRLLLGCSSSAQELTLVVKLLEESDHVVMTLLRQSLTSWRLHLGFDEEELLVEMVDGRALVLDRLQVVLLRGHVLNGRYVFQIEGSHLGATEGEASSHADRSYSVQAVGVLNNLELGGHLAQRPWLLEFFSPRNVQNDVDDAFLLIAGDLILAVLLEKLLQSLNSNLAKALGLVVVVLEVHNIVKQGC